MKLYHKDSCCSGVVSDHDHCNCTHQQHEHTKEIKKVKYKFKVNHLDCANCALKVEQALLKLNYINDVSLNFSSSLLFVDTNRNDEDKLIKDIEMEALKVEDGIRILKYESDEISDVSHTSEIIQLTLGIIMLVMSVFLEKEIGNISFILYLITYLIVGYRVILTAIKNILKGDFFDENFLMSIATIGAFALSDYKEAIAVMLFYDIGELFQSYAVNRSRRSIRDLMNINSDYAIVLRDGKEVQVTPEELLVNDLVVVKAGERIPSDGVIVEGASSLDVSALSGESLPKDVSVDDEVLAGCLNINGLFTMRVNKLACESTLSRVLDLVENASSKKAHIEKFITKFSRIYTPIVVLAAILIVLIPTLLFGYDSFATWLYRGCIFLVVSCPCALVVSIPLGLFAGIGASGKQGVLVKGGNYLELLSDMDTIVFDKTGTITKGSFKVEKVIGNDNTLMLAAYGESHSNHPIAKSIVNEYKEVIDQSKLKEYIEVAGQGIKTLFEDKILLVGNAKLLIENNIEFSENKELGSIIYVAFNQKYIGSIVINDEIKPTSKKAIKALKDLGIKTTIMLSGDKNEIAQSVASKVGIDEVHAQLLPQDKVRVLETYLKNKSHKVAFVGDGINDAPVLMRADIGIAMGGIGSDAAIEASDVVLMRDDLMSIATSIKIARKTKAILYQNIIFSLLIKFSVLVLTVFGLANMWMGVFADVVVTLIAILNAMRAMIIDKRLDSF